MPEMSSCASGRHRPPASSASWAYVTLPPSTGLVLSAELLAEPPEPELPLALLFLLLPPHAAAARTKTSSTARSRRGVVRGDEGFSTFPPGLCWTTRQRDVRKHL